PLLLASGLYPPVSAVATMRLAGFIPSTRQSAMLNKSVLIALAMVIWTFANQVMAKPLAATANNARRVITLDGGWRFREVNKADWHAATVPGCVHTDLLNNRLIEDPFYRDNEQKQKWIGKTDWENRTTFKAGAELLAVHNIEL